MLKSGHRNRSVLLLSLAFFAALALVAVCRVSGTSVELLPVNRWDFNGPRTLSMIALGPEGGTAMPIARITTVGCLRFWTPLQ